MKLLIALLLIFLNPTKTQQVNVSYEALHKCKQYNAVSGYNYKSFFRINELKNNNPGNEDIVNMKLYVLASKDAHILLTSRDTADSTDPHYEIVIGAGGNKFSEIRKQRKKNPLITKSTKNILSPIEPLPLILQVTKNGLIQLSVQGVELPMMSAIDDKVDTIKYISFSTWGVTQGKWFYDCDEIEDIEVVEPPKTIKDNLIEYLYYKMMHATNVESCTISEVNFKRIAYNSMKAVMQTIVSLKLTFVQPEGVWDPSDYENITVLDDDILRLSMWQPTLILDNGLGSQFTNPDINYRSPKCDYNGTTTIETFESILETVCTLKPGSTNWPADSNYCDIIFSQPYPASIPIHLAAEGIILGNNFQQSEWKLVQVSKYETEDLDNFYFRKDSLGNPIKQLVIRIHLKRNHLLYKEIFFAPYFCAMVMILSSFFLHGRLRLFLIALGLLILAGVFVNTARYAPRTYVPKIIRYYQTSLILTWVCFLLFIVDSWFQKHPPIGMPHIWIIRFINFPFVRFVMGLQSNNSYDYLQEKNFEWKEISKLLDRFFFISIFFFFIGASFNCY